MLQKGEMSMRKNYYGKKVLLKQLEENVFL